MKRMETYPITIQFFLPGSENVDLGISPMLKLMLGCEHGWGGWYPVKWRGTEDKALQTFSNQSKPTVLPTMFFQGSKMVKQLKNGSIEQ